MKTNKRIFVLAILGLFAGSYSAAHAAAPKPRMSAAILVSNLYKQHKRRSPFFQAKSRALLDRYFDRTLVNLILQDAIRSKGEVGAIDGDPLFNAQDMEIKKFAIHDPVYSAGTAGVRVSFENFGQPKEITFLLIQRGSDWRITNIKYDDGADLRGILENAATGAASKRDVKVYLIALDDKGKRGRKVGCDDSLVPVTRSIPATKALLKAALQELLSLPPESADYPGLQNFWKGDHLALKSVAIAGGTATIRISGTVSVAGVCDEPRIVGQLEATARQFSSVKKVRVFIGKQTLAAAIR
ncbi:MAG: hypothetical protein QOE77_675 [Blastocatellia bacterium]|jgi:hypothetical protein|nr:hypothetical protein [Blastocatellia bacterium]